MFVLLEVPEINRSWLDRVNFDEPLREFLAMYFNFLAIKYLPVASLNNLTSIPESWLAMEFALPFLDSASFCFLKRVLYANHPFGLG